MSEYNYMSAIQQYVSYSTICQDTTICQLYNNMSEYNNMSAIQQYVRIQQYVSYTTIRQNTTIS